jgi:predicted MFS family arabinose efflux permease
MLLVAIVYVVVAMPVVGWLLTWHERHPASAAARDASQPAAPVTDAPPSFFRDPRFWLAVFVFAVVPVGTTALTFHQVGLFRAAGLADALVPVAFMCYAVSHAVMTLAAGSFVDRLSPATTGAVGSGGLLLGMLVLAVPAHPVVTAMTYAVLLGAGAALAGLGGALVWPAMFGASSIGRLRGVSSGIRNCATALGPLMITLHAGAGVLSSITLVIGLSIAGMLAAQKLRLAGAHQAPTGR